VCIQLQAASAVQCNRVPRLLANQTDSPGSPSSADSSSPAAGFPPIKSGEAGLSTVVMRLWYISNLLSWGYRPTFNKLPTDGQRWDKSDGVSRVHTPLWPGR